MLSLVVIFFARCAEASVCIKRDSCHYKNTRLAGVPFQNISTKDIHPGSRSCASKCALTDGCVGVTLDPQEEICHLYHENNTLEIIEDPVLSLWLFQAPGVPCVQVSWLAPIAYSNTKPFDRSKWYIICYYENTAAVRPISLCDGNSGLKISQWSFVIRFPLFTIYPSPSEAE